MRKLTLLVLLTMVFTSPALYAAKVYKWVDADGNVNYSATPPKGQAKEMDIQSQPSAPTADAAANRNEARQKFLEGYDKDREEKAKTETKAAEEKAVRDQNCATARKNLASLKLGGRQFEMTADGERHYLDDAEMQKRIQQNEAYVKEWCDQQ